MNFKLFLLKSSLFLVCLLWVSKIQAQSINLSNETTLERDELFYQTLSILPTEKIPAQYQEIIQNIHPVKCATMQYRLAMHEFARFTPEQQTVLKTAFLRPVLPFSHVSESGRFRVHYTLTGFDAVNGEDLDSNGVPDYVEAVAKLFEESYTSEIDDLGFRIPPNDGNIDGDEYDVYIQGLGFGVYGLTTPELSSGEAGQTKVPSYISIDNDFENGQFTRGLPGAQVTAAHEYLHAIQFGYRDAFFRDEYFYYELCSSWVEDIVYDDVNDYFASVPDYLNETDKPFNQFKPQTLFNYGAAIWYHFLREKYNNTDLVRTAWEYMGDGQLVLDAIENSLRQIGTDFNSEFAEFAIWNYFTGSRSDAINFYEEGDGFAQIDFEDEFIFRNDTTLTDSTLTLSCKYYKFTTTESGSFLVTGSAEQNKDWLIAAITKLPGQSSKIFVESFGEELGLENLPISSEIILIPVYLKALQNSSSFAFSGTFGNYQVSLLRFDLQDNQDNGVKKIFPNPFIVGQHTAQTFEFNQVTTIELEVNIVSFGGKVVRSVSLANNEGTLSSSGFQWDGRDDDGNTVPSGIYMLRLKQGKNSDLVKFAVVNK